MGPVTYQLDTHDRPRLLSAMMRALAADDCRISFEGVLSQTELAEMEGGTREESGVLKRATLWPKLDFFVFALTQRTLSAIEKAIISKVAFGERGIIHVQIEQNGEMAFAAYDGFQHVAAYSAVSSALLEELTESRVLRGYQRVLQSTT